MAATGGSLVGGPYRIDVTPQAPTFYALPDDNPPVLPANAPFTLIGDTSNSGSQGLESTRGWMHLRPAETPAVELH